MVTLHHLNNSRSQRIIWLLEELNIEYQVKRYERDAKTSLAPKELEAIHPLGKSPVITDGEKTIAESGLIIEYLIQTYGNGQFAAEQNTPQYWQDKYWLHYAEGSLMPLLVIALMFEKVRTAPMPFFIKPIARTIADKAMAAYAGPNLTKHLTYIDQHLADNQWFCGEQKTAADFQMVFPLEAALARDTNNTTYRHISRYVNQVHSLENYKTALKKGGPYDYA